MAKKWKKKYNFEQIISEIKSFFLLFVGGGFAAGGAGVVTGDGGGCCLLLIGFRAGDDVLDCELVAVLFSEIQNGQIRGKYKLINT